MDKEKNTEINEEKEENMKMQSQIFNNSGGFGDKHNEEEEE